MLQSGIAEKFVAVIITTAIQIQIGQTGQSGKWFEIGIIDPSSGIGDVKMSQAMAETSKTIGNMNKMMNPTAVAKTMKDFEMANTKMGMTEEMMNEALDDMLTESGDKEEEDAIVNQVLDEIGIEVSGKVFMFHSVVHCQSLLFCSLMKPLQQPKEPSVQKQFQRRTKKLMKKLKECLLN